MGRPMIQGRGFRDTPGGTLIHVRVRPRSNPAVVLNEEQLIISVAGPPAEGRATEEARRSLAHALEVRASAVSLRTGPRSRDKVFFVSGLDARQVRASLRPYRGHRG